ncbi:MAG: 4-alpha-glucanotransferase [Oscillospiraceae bacterium]|nr:4-alpha-glucanotransferase [Oscillospiraceae bacterium]
MRESGILLPVSALPSRYGVGCFDAAAYAFVDQLARAGQRVWQILPLGPTGYGDSPYQSFSTFAGNPYFISLDELVRRGWLTREECDAADFGGDARYVDYGALYQQRLPLLRLAYVRSEIADDPAFRAFVERQRWWLEDYALYMAIKDANGGRSWQEWEDGLKLRRAEALAPARAALAEEIGFYQFLQFCFFTQWHALLDYAHGRGVRILGDIPIYVALDSADAWAAPELFQLDDGRRPRAVSGCPPDAFAADGQVWGNPLYRWDYHRETGYAWWIRRIAFCFEIYDILRIDHFRGFDEYFSIPAGDQTAHNGHWEKGPGLELFRAIEGRIGQREIVAEDLGYVTDTVRQLVTDTGFPGMKVFEFAFDSRDTGSAADNLPHNYLRNSVAYTGTHDNATLLGWLGEITPEEYAQVQDYLATGAEGAQLCHQMVCAVLRSVSRLAVIPMQDHLALGNEARINQPSSQGTNWRWRLLPDEFSRELEGRIRKLTQIYGRL